MEATKAQHFPGPWQVDAPGPDEEQTWVVTAAHPSFGDVQADVANVWNEPNARLIAAAPSYFEALEGDGSDPQLAPRGALRAIVATVEQLVDEGVFTEDHDPEAIRLTLAEARRCLRSLDAIAKAVRP